VICERPVQYYSEVFGLGAEGQSCVVVFDLSSCLASFLLRWKAADAVFVALSFSLQGTHLQLPCPCQGHWSVRLVPTPLPANLHQHA